MILLFNVIKKHKKILLIIIAIGEGKVSLFYFIFQILIYILYMVIRGFLYACHTSFLGIA